MALLMKKNGNLVPVAISSRIVNEISTYDSILENNSWSKIKEACESGDPILATWLGQTKSSSYNGYSTSFRLVDTYVGRYKFDDNSDNHAVFEMVNSTSNKSIYDNTTGGVGYVGSVLKSTFDNTNFNYLAYDLKPILKNTTVKSIKGGTNSSTVYDATNCKIFPASVVEMFGTKNYSDYANETNGGQFEYYINKTATDRIKLPAGNSSIYQYWLRSPNISDYRFGIVINTAGEYQSTEYYVNRERYGSVCFAL